MALKTALSQISFNERELYVRHCDRQRDAWKAAARTYIKQCASIPQKLEQRQAVMEVSLFQLLQIAGCDQTSGFVPLSNQFQILVIARADLAGVTLLGGVQNGV